ncbi:FH protein interacting protein FIP2 [Glycine max]|nr:FH protein interacting protein FIP2 [Glycine max]
MKGFQSDLSSAVRLNIGGKKFCTTTDTLTQREPDSMLAAMFSGRHTLDGKHFRHILNWLRDGVVPTLEESQYSELLREAEYYQLLGLIDGIHSVLNKKNEDDEFHTELTRTDIIKCIQSEKVRFRGVNLSGLDLSKLDLSYVDFSYACLKNVFFSRANLQCAKFRDVDAEGSIFHNATLRECEFTAANLRGALLAGACLQSANLQGLEMFYVYMLYLFLTILMFGINTCIVSTCLLVISTTVIYPQHYPYTQPPSLVALYGVGYIDQCIGLYQNTTISVELYKSSHPLQSVEGVGGGDGGAEECEDELGAVLEEE